MPSPPRSPDFLILGAGVAGLAAARYLRQRNLNPLVLEARNRIGGRIATLHPAQTPIPVELGAEFVHGLHPDLWTLLDEAHLPAVEARGEHLTATPDGPRESTRFDDMAPLFEALSRATPDQSFDHFLRHTDADPEAKTAITGFIEGFNAARKELVGTDWLNTESRAASEIDEDRNFRLLSGYDAVPRHLAQNLDIRLETPVRRLRWQKDEVIAETDTAEFRAPRAIVTVPFALLAANGLPIHPEPAALTNARRAIATGHALRVTFRFPTAVWEKYPRLSFLHADQPFPVWWTPYPVRTTLITGWAAGPKADALAARSEAEIVAIALASLRHALHEDPGPPDAVFFHDWRHDPWSLGAYSYGLVNGAAARRALADPIDETLCFAGEAVCPAGHMGTVHGAISSGLAAAHALLPRELQHLPA